MKTNKKILFIISILILILLIVCGFYYVCSYRFKVSEQMQDYEYKKQIVSNSHNLFYSVEPLRNLVGKSELEQFIKDNNNNQNVYNSKNRHSKQFKANLHMHTINSDGTMSVREILTQAEKYGEFLPEYEYMYVAITDHNTINGAKDVIKELEKNYKKYPKVKVIAGIEINTTLSNKELSPEDIQIHVLCWAINPYNKTLNKIFYKKDKHDRYNVNYEWIPFEELFKTVQPYGITGIAHPARYTEQLNEKRFQHISTMLDKYKKSSLPNQPLFIEGFYQSYPDDIKADKKYLEHINKEADKRNIIKTGSYDTHGISIFKR